MNPQFLLLRRRLFPYLWCRLPIVPVEPLDTDGVHEAEWYIMCVCVCSFYPSRSNTTSVRADSAILYVVRCGYTKQRYKLCGHKTTPQTLCVVSVAGIVGWRTSAPPMEGPLRLIVLPCNIVDCCCGERRADVRSTTTTTTQASTAPTKDTSTNNPNTDANLTSMHHPACSRATYRIIYTHQVSYVSDTYV